MTPVQAADLGRVIDRVTDRHGFLRPEDLRALAALDRLRPVLIRWHEGRATCPAQDAQGLIDASGRGGWTLRDVSLPANDAAYVGPWAANRV